MRTLSTFCAAAAAVTLLATPTAAQVSFGAGGLYASLSGSDFQDTNAGIGVDGQIRVGSGPGFTIGAGAQFTSHGVSGIDPNWSVIGVFGDPRYEFPTASGSLRPYLWGRAGWITASISDGSNELSQSGIFFGGGGGLRIASGGPVAFDVGILVAKIDFGEQKFNGTGTGFNPSGTSIVLRAGVLFGR